jgi:hypothetical protein
VLVVADPTKPIGPEEVGAIERYVKEGGNVLLMLGPNAANSLDFPILGEVLGLSRAPNPVCQVTTVMGAGGIWRSEANVFSIDKSYSDHAIVKPLKTRGSRTFWEDVCAITAGRPNETGQTGLGLDPLCWSANDAWIDLPGPDHKYNHQFDPGVEDRNKAPYVLGYAVTRKDASGKELGRAVVFGCASFVDDKVLMSAPANRDLGLNAIDWLSGREQLIAITPKPFDIVQVDLTEKEYGTIFLYVVIGVPAVALALGVAVYWMRRN